MAVGHILIYQKELYLQNEELKAARLHAFVGRVLRLRRNTRWQQYASFYSILSRAGLRHIGKGWIVRRTTT